MGESIKDRIIQAAQSDPFLSVGEIARLVGTTQQYVRTILSESGYSLTKLRRDYVKKMERRVGQARAGTELTLPAQEKLEIRQISAPHLAKLLGVPEDSPLFQASRVLTQSGFQGLGQLVTGQNLTLRPDCTRLCELLPVPLEALTMRKQWAVVVPAPKALQELLGLDMEERVFRLGSLWESQGRPVAVEFFWIPAEGYVLTWPGQGGGLSLDAYEETSYG